MILTDDPVIRCSSCGAEHKIDKDLLDDDACCIGKGSMGEQYEHDFAYDCYCQNCGQRMWFKLYAMMWKIRSIQGICSGGIDVLSTFQRGIK